MSNDKSNSRKVEEPATAYRSIPKQKGIGLDFDFEKESKSGYTPDEFLVEMKKRISKFPWKK
ncbi:hypothetical protein ACFSX9_14275 [Flavobacterium ardleyense]|uniref:Uncharacterized protein n=1 Tax=Flavobacterium ardleyense TaxID=2038737 RepID=A0ABW5ZAI0_9FLAO